MNKRSIISLSIFCFMIALIGVLFGAVFRLRIKSVSVIDYDVVEITKSEVLSASGLKNGQSIFMIDKQKAIDNIEKKFPYVKVVQIKTTSLIEINIVLRSRHELFYAEFEDKFLILDEDLKVLEIVTTKPENLTHVDLKIDKQANICDFIGDKHQRNIAYKLYRAMINNVKSKTEIKTKYYTRQDLCKIIQHVEFEKNQTFDKLILKTKYGIKYDIENPNKDLTNKMNICLTTTNKFIEDEKGKEKTGTIKIYYDLNNIQKCVYIP